MNKQKRLGEEKVSKLLLQFSVPAIIGMIVTTLYNIIDRIFIGHIPGVGNFAIAGVGITMPITTIIMAFGMLIGIGTATRISINLGQRNKEKAEEHLGNAFTLTILIGIILTAVGLIFKDQILFAFGASKNTIIYAEQYIEIVLCGCIFNLVGFSINHSIRSDGNPKIAMLSMLIGAVLNIILDPVFIFIFNLGVQGAALATVISQIVSAVWVVYYFTKGSGILKIRKKYLKLNKFVVVSIFSIGVSPFSMQIASCAVQIISNNSLEAYGGDLAVAAMTVINSFSMIFMMPIFGLNQGMQPIVGYNFGARQIDRVKEAIRYCIITATIIVIVGFFVVEFFPDKMMLLFNSDPELINIGANGMRIFLCMIPFVGAQIIITNYFQSTGRVKISMFLSLLRQAILLIPCLIVLPIFKGLDGVWLAGATSDFISVIITIIVFKKFSKELSKDDAKSSIAVEG